MTNAIPPTNCFNTLYIHSQNESDSNLTSSLAIASLLDSGAFNSLLKIPTYTMITQMFNVCHHDQHDTKKTLTTANHSEVPNKQYISEPCFSTIETKSRCLMIPFAVPDFKYNILGTSFIR